MGGNGNGKDRRGVEECERTDRNVVSVSEQRMMSMTSFLVAKSGGFSQVPCPTYSTLSDKTKSPASR